ncbi:MAG TPA: MarR family transcriptional regulator, partial [Mycobacteriales bacterium]|nr:MarR family transcriptional regulator [Mycobacteriales bacterium]
PLSQQDLARCLLVNRTIMVGLVDGLEERDLVRRERNPADRRSYALAPTELGLKQLRLLEPALERAEAVLTANLTATERRRLHATLLRAVPDLDTELAGPLAGQTGFLLKHAHYRRRGLATEALSPLRIEPRQFGALLTLRQLQPCSQQELAAGLGITPPVVLQLIDELERLNLVTRSRNEHDRRSYELTLTAEGERRLDRALELVTRLSGEDRSDRTVRELHGLLRKLLGPS